jgi:hypothetical protein
MVCASVCLLLQKSVQRGSVLTAAPTTDAQVNRTSWAQPQHELLLGARSHSDCSSEVGI